jgi:hypothetical protein
VKREITFSHCLSHEMAGDHNSTEGFKALI